MAQSQTINYQHRIILSPQPTDMSCWSAATTMLFGSTFSAGPGDATVGSSGDLKPDVGNLQAFAKSYGLRIYPMQSWSVDGLIRLLKRGPVAMLGAMPSLHAVVIGGITSDGTPKGTILKIYDPWPPNQGSVYNINYEEWMKKYPLSTIYMLQR